MAVLLRMKRPYKNNFNLGLVALFVLLCLGCARPIATTYPLHNASAAGDLRKVRSILEKEGNINIKDSEGNTALVHAIAKEHWPVADELLERGCSLDYVNELGSNPFLQFAKYGSAEQKKWINRNFHRIKVDD